MNSAPFIHIHKHIDEAEKSQKKSYSNVPSTVPEPLC